MAQKFQRKQTEILETAARIFNTNGVKDSTIAMLAEAAGMTTTNLTYYFKRKEDLAAACYRHAFDELEKILSEVQQEETPLDRLKRFVQLQVRYLVEMYEGKAPYTIGFGHLISLEDPIRTEIIDKYITYFRSLRRLIEPLNFNKKNRPQLNVNTLFLIEQINQCRAWLQKHRTYSGSRIAERMFDILAFGIGPNNYEWFAPESVKYDPPNGSKEVFLQSATKLINSEGHRGASIEKIAAGLGLTKASFFHHYRSKDHVIESCYDRTFSVVDKVFGKLEISEKNREQLNAAISNLVRFQLDPSGPLLATVGVSALPSAKKVQINERLSRLVEDFRDLIIDGSIDGSLRPIDPIIAAEMSIPIIFSASQLTIWFPDFANAQNAAELFVQPLFKGIFHFGDTG